MHDAVCLLLHLSYNRQPGSQKLPLFLVDRECDKRFNARENGLGFIPNREMSPVYRRRKIKVSHSIKSPIYFPGFSNWILETTVFTKFTPEHYILYLEASIKI